jgi:hypothetical protein
LWYTCILVDGNVKGTVYNIRNEEESNKYEKERGTQKGRTKKRKRNIEGKIYKNEKRSQKKFKKKRKEREMT